MHVLENLYKNLTEKGDKRLCRNTAQQVRFQLRPLCDVCNIVIFDIHIALWKLFNNKLFPLTLHVNKKKFLWEIHNGLSLWGSFQSLVAFFCYRIGMDGHILYPNICEWPICFFIHWQFL